MPVSKQNRFLLLYGSQTGQAKAIAEEIAEKSQKNNLQADLYCLSLTEKKFYIEREQCVVIVTSTTGDGEPPDTALKFIRRLKKKTLPANHLAHLNYALLGLGDSNYTNFCNCAKSLDRRLQELGAKRFYDCGWADDAVGLEVAVEPWIDGLWAAVKRQLYGSDAVSSCSSCDHTREVIRFSREPQLSAPTDCDTKLLLQNGSDSDMAPAIDQSHLLNDRTASKNSENLNQSKLEERTKNKDSEGENQSSRIQHLNVETVEKRINLTTDKNVSVTQNEIKSSSETESLSDKLTSLALGEQSNTASQSNESDINQSCHLQESPTNCSAADSNSDVGISIGIAAEKISVRRVREEQRLPAETVCLDVPNIQESVPPLSNSDLGVPVLSPAYLKIEYHPGVHLNTSELPLQNGCQFPSAASPVALATVTSAVTMTACDAVKKTMSVQLDISDCNIQYEPGDSFSLICPNNQSEVEQLLQRFGILNNVDTVYQLSILTDTKKKNAAIPKHVPEKGTLRHLFTTCLDIREPPKKALLRVLVEHTSDSREKRRLQELCSKQGSNDYSKFIREPSLSLLDILNHFPSCMPPVERILEHLSRLQPRPYSICSSSLNTPNSVEFVFNVVDIECSEGRTYTRKGVCTGWLEKFERCKDASEGSEKVIKVPIFARTSQHFHLPKQASIPVIMVGPGTGVAPFLGFLRHRTALMGSGLDEPLGEAFLFYGCRQKDRDYLYRVELQEHLSSGSLSKLFVCFSRDTQPGEGPRYVQDNIRAHGERVVRLIEDQQAVVYVCGDAKNMAKDVNQAFVSVFSAVNGITQEEAAKLVMQLRLKKQYLEDVWT